MVKGMTDKALVLNVLQQLPEDSSIESIYETYSVHLHFWCEGFPGGMSDFRRFFQYLRPQDAAPLGLKESARKGIVHVEL